MLTHAPCLNDVIWFQPKAVSLTPLDPRWVGAWWMGFFLLSWPLIFSGVLLLCFPKEMPTFKKKREQALKEGDLPTANDNMGKSIRGFATATLDLLKNATYVFTVLGVTVRTFFGSAIGSFFAKIVLLKFGGTSFQIALSIGAVMLPAMSGRSIHSVDTSDQMNISSIKHTRNRIQPRSGLAVKQLMALTVVEY